MSTYRGLQSRVHRQLRVARTRVCPRVLRSIIDNVLEEGLNADVWAADVVDLYDDDRLNEDDSGDPLRDGHVGDAAGVLKFRLGNALEAVTSRVRESVGNRSSEPGTDCEARGLREHDLVSEINRNRRGENDRNGSNHEVDAAHVEVRDSDTVGDGAG